MKVNYKFKTEPYDHQYDAWVNNISRSYYAYFMEMGTGKSKVLIDTIAYLSNTHQLDFALIIAPKGVYRNWVNREIPQHFPDDIRRSLFYWQANNTKKYRDEFKRFFASKEQGVKIFVMNVEAFSSAKGKSVGAWLAKRFGSSGMIAIDESTTIKNPKAARTKALLKLSPEFKYCRILTGSPVTKSPLDLFSQCDFLNPSLLGFDSFYAFQNRYAIIQKRSMGSHSFQHIVGYRNLEELTRKIDDFSSRVLKKDCLDLPDKIYTIRDIELTTQQKTMYNDIARQAMTLLEDGGLVTAMQVITQLLRYQQILCGHLKTDDGDIIEFPTNRLSALIDCIEEISGKVIIWSRFRYDIKKIFSTLSDKFGEDSVVCYYGDTSDDDRELAIEKFQNGDSRFLVANPATAGYGLTLTAANTVIYYANDFNLETRMQSEDRCHRLGQKNTVTYIDFICEDTVDEKIVKSLRNKIDIGAKVLGEEAREWLRMIKQ